MQSNFEARIAELTTEVRMKTFQTERAALSQEESLAHLKQANVVIEQQRKKIEVSLSTPQRFD